MYAQISLSINAVPCLCIPGFLQSTRDVCDVSNQINALWHETGFITVALNGVGQLFPFHGSNILRSDNAQRQRKKK